jgi:hypothetical protein
MADIGPNLEVRKMQLKIRRSELRLNIERMDLRKLELKDEESRINENMKATHKALEELNKEIGE